MSFMSKITIVAAASLALGHTGFHAQAQDYPSQDIQGVIMWGAGGATDNVARAVTPAAEQALGGNIILSNRTGGAGAISTAYVSQRPADGYTLLYGAENPLLHRVLGLSQISFIEEFYPVNVLAQGFATIVVHADSPYETMEDLLATVAESPGEIRMGGTGPGGQPHVVRTLIDTVTDFDVTEVPFDGEGPAVTALLGGHVEFVPAGLAAVSEYIRAGRLRALSTMTLKPVELLDDVPAITSALPEMERYLPWGSFYGVWVRRGTPEEITVKLEEVYHEVASTEKFTDFISNLGALPLNISGEEADEFLQRWRSVTTWVLHDAGATEVSPEEFDIPRP